MTQLLSNPAVMLTSLLSAGAGGTTKSGPYHSTVYNTLNTV